jgi:hypothetical protein
LVSAAYYPSSLAKGVSRSGLVRHKYACSHTTHAQTTRTGVHATLVGFAVYQSYQACTKPDAFFRNFMDNATMEEDLKQTNGSEEKVSWRPEICAYVSL